MIETNQRTANEMHKIHTSNGEVAFIDCKKQILLKGAVARDFRPSVFFHQSTPPRALIQGLKPLKLPEF
jgi:hypothetical protein